MRDEVGPFVGAVEMRQIAAVALIGQERRVAHRLPERLGPDALEQVA